MSFDAVKKLGMRKHENFDPEIKKYFREIKRQLHCPRSRKRAFLNQFLESLAQYREEHPRATFPDIVAEFGNPQEIASSFIEQADSVKIGKSLNLGRRIFWVVIAAAVIAVATIAGFSAYRVWQNENFANGFYLETISQGDVPVPLESIDESNIRSY